MNRAGGRSIEEGRLAAAREAMSRFYGPLHWWPAGSPFEVVIGAILTQNTAWRRVEPAIANLKDRGLLDARRLHAVGETELAGIIRPAGTYRVKARYLRAVTGWLVETYGGDLAAALRGDTMAKRAELLALPGVGRETADSILLYAGGHPIFVVDAYTRRIFSRHGFITGREDYDEIREWFTARLPRDAAVLNEFHAQIVNVGKDFCRPRAPRCANCPLRFLLEDGSEPVLTRRSGTRAPRPSGVQAGPSAPRRRAGGSGGRPPPRA